MRKIKAWTYGFSTGISLLLADKINALRVDNGMDAMWTLYIAFPTLVYLIKFAIEQQKQEGDFQPLENQALENQPLENRGQ
jgi:hypothetical protein